MSPSYVARCRCSLLNHAAWFICRTFPWACTPFVVRPVLEASIPSTSIFLLITNADVKFTSSNSTHETGSLHA